MAGNETKELTFIDLSGNVSVVTGNSTEFVVRKTPLMVLEMEDALFHSGSAVIMPDDPSGNSTSQGGGAKQEQERVAGIKALALVFRQFEHDRKKRMLITGHAERTASTKANFEISKARALNVLHFLTGKAEAWTQISAMNHVLEDCQQIMKYFHHMRGWNCDPDKIDGAWGRKTSAATEAFFGQCNKLYTAAKPLDAALVQRDAKHRWSEQVWAVIYKLYEEELIQAVIGGNRDPKEFAKKRSLLKFADDKKPCVACGDSFPIDGKEKKNYRSQKNRRVEILFFDENEIPKLTCPAHTDKPHTSKECPLWDKLWFRRTYIKPDDVNTAVYHLQFTYFNRIKNETLSVPDGLKLKVFRGEEPAQFGPTVYRNGVLEVRLFNAQNGARDPKVRFAFETTHSWVYTKDKNTAPKIVSLFSDVDPKLPKTPITREELAKRPFAERLHYYDLPEQWDSRNWECKTDKGMRVFSEVVKDVTAVTNPMVFSLDTVVLVDEDFDPAISDQDSTGANKPLCADSRYTLFYIDSITLEQVGGERRNMQRLRIYRPDEDQPFYTDGGFSRNCISNVPGGARAVYFCNAFYDITNRRSTESSKKFGVERGHLVGARLALKDDSSVHGQSSIAGDNANDISECLATKSCGNFELHYLHGCALHEGKELSYLVVYWSCRFERRPIMNGAAVAINAGSALDMRNHTKVGIKNATDRLNKPYEISAISGRQELTIRPFHFIEAKVDSCGGREKTRVNIVANQTVANKPTIAWMKKSSAQFRARDYKDDTNYFGNADPDNNLRDTDGKTYSVLTNHHEIGHATGHWDDYVYSLVEGNREWWGLARFSQPFTAPGGPYRFDKLGRMSHNRTPRIRNYWKYVLWLKRESQPRGKLYGFLGNAQFRILFKTKDFTHRYVLKESYRNTSAPSKSALGYSLANSGKADILLYKLGDDEFARMLPGGGIYDAIVVLRVNIALRFVDDPAEPANTWDLGNPGDSHAAKALKWAQELRDEYNSLNGKFRIESGDPKQIDEAGAEVGFYRISVLFSPHFTVYGPNTANASAEAGTHFRITVTYRIGNGFVAPAAGDLAVDWDTSKQRIAGHTLGRTAAPHGITIADLQRVQQWLASREVGNARYRTVAI